MPRDRRDGGELLQRVLGGGAEDLGDGPVREADLERLAVVAGAVADLARHVDVRQEVHLDLQGSVAGARLAAAALDVEAEATHLVAADLRLLRRGEQLADVVEDADVGGGVGPRGPADGRLVDPDHLVDQAGAGQPRVAARDLLAAHDLAQQRAREDVVDQRRLPAARHPRHRDQAPERERRGDVVEVVLPRPLDDEGVARLRRAPRVRHGDRAPPGQVVPGDRLRVLQERLDGARVDDLPAVLAGAGADVDDPVRRAHRVLVVLDDDEGVARVAQALQRADQPCVVALVQPDARLVEDVQHADQAGTDLRRQPDPLRLTAGQRPGRPPQREVVEPDVDQEGHTGADLPEHRPRDRLGARAQRQLGEEPLRLPDRQVADLGDGPPADGDGEDDGLQPRAVALRARHLAQVARPAFPRRVGLRVGVAALQERQHPLEAGGVAPLAAVAVAVAHLDRVGAAVQHQPPRALRQPAPRLRRREALLLRQRRQQAAEVLLRLPAVPRRDRAVVQRQLRVRDHQLRVDLLAGRRGPSTSGRRRTGC